MYNQAQFLLIELDYTLVKYFLLIVKFFVQNCL